MQKWYDEGYFTPDLLMKRTHMDTDWTPVGELSLRAGNERLFFSSFTDHGPPGLALRPTAPPTESETFDRLGQSLGHNMAIPPQPSELHTTGSPLHHFHNPTAIRTPTLDTYLGATPSNATDSPASSSAIASMASASPDLSFGVGNGRQGFGTNTEPAFSGRVGGFDSQPSSSSFGAHGGNTGFTASTDTTYVPRLASLGHRGAMFESQGFNSVPASVTPNLPWSAGISGSVPRNPEAQGLGNISIHRTSVNNGAFGHSPVPNASSFNEIGSHDPTVFTSDTYSYANSGYSQLGRGALPAESLPSAFGPIGQGGGSRDQSLRHLQDLDGASLNNRHGLDELPRASSSFSNGFGASASSIVHTQGSGFGVHAGQAQHQQQNVQQLSQQLPPISTFGQPTALAPSSPHSAAQLQPQSVANLPVAQPLWGIAQTSAQPRPRPFDAPHPTSSNVVKTPIPSNDAVPFNLPQGHLESSDWYTASKPEIHDGWGDISTVAVPSGAVPGNDNNQGQSHGWTTPPRTSPAPFDRAAELASASQGLRSTPTPPQVQSQPQSRDSVSQTAPKKRGSGSQAPQQAVSKPSAAASGVLQSTFKPPSPLPASAQAKPAWSTLVPGTEDENKTTKQTGLRAIQEAEAKRVEARKTAEREKERAARAQPQEETQTFTASWGLPTSQAGAGRSASKEQTPALAAQAVTSPVWINATKPLQTKRTMKDIQEEEEQRKKAAAQDKEAAMAAARRAYSGSSNKVS